MAAKAESTVTIKLLDDGRVQVELEQQQHLYTADALEVAELALKDLRAHLVSEQTGYALWDVDWPAVPWPGR